jgi:hypothetical protein
MAPSARTGRRTSWTVAVAVADVPVPDVDGSDMVAAAVADATTGGGATVVAVVGVEADTAGLATWLAPGEGALAHAPTLTRLIAATATTPRRRPPTLCSSIIPVPIPSVPRMDPDALGDAS